MYNEDENTLIFINYEETIDLKSFLKDKGLSGRMISKALRSGEIKINSNSCKGKDIVNKGARVYFRMEEEDSDMMPQKMDLEILFEDLDILVLDKKPFILVHPTPNHPEGTLSNGVAYYFIEKGIKRKVRILNRLDRDTSGVIVFAKNPYGHQQLAGQMEKGSIEKKYLAVVHGIVKSDSGLIDLPLGKHEDGIRQTVRKDGLQALTKYRVMERMQDSTLLELELVTGRTHQIRVHLSHIGHPIMGDNLYSEMEAPIDRQALHAYSLSFYTPRSGECVNIKTDMPEDMKKLIRLLKISKY
ncbi:RluA family pseudouridine synthase [Gudongella sp. DL1XJH-153]|uniref:RluA family pseudouridine synthase n=1 Tax=Gudongella sp. DL1XJH-153 TaxID=3409804 RepID=UPI003BB76E15